VGIGDADGDIEVAVGVTVTVEVRRGGAEPLEQAPRPTRTTTIGRMARRVPRTITLSP
jgi:hypothetical protein